MKLLFAVCATFFISFVACAGSNNCTSVTEVTSGSDYYAQSSDCIIRVSKSTNEYTRVHLPVSLSGETFTIQENLNTAALHCEDIGDTEDWCWTGGTSGFSPPQDISFYDMRVDELVMYSFHPVSQTTNWRQYTTFSFDGSQWNTTQGTW